MDHVNGKYKHSYMTDAIICSFYTVYNSLGYGFLEKVYRNALLLELQRRKLPAEGEKIIHVYYLNQVVGEYYATKLLSK